MNILLRNARLQAHLTQEDLADVLGSNQTSVWRWENGVIPSSYYRQLLCDYFQQSPEMLGWPAFQQRQSKKPGECLVDPLLLSPSHLLRGRPHVLTFLQKRLGLAGKCQCIGIIGVAGSGKTVVLQQLAATESTQKHFAGVLWASVAPEHSIKPHVQRWAALLGIQRLPEDLAKLQKLVHTTIGQRRFLFLLDDVHEAEALTPFFLGGPNCRYVLTTRFPRVARQVCHHALLLPRLDR